MVRPRSFLVTVSAALILVAGCGGDDGTADGTSSTAATSSTSSTPVFVETDSSTTPATAPATTVPAGATSSAPATTSPATTAADPATTAPEEEPATTPPAATTTAPTTGEACLVGTWRLRDQPFLDQLTAQEDTAGQIEFVEHRGGSYTASIAADGTFLGERDDWQFAFGTIQGTIITTVSSTDPGTWTTDGERITIDADAGDLTVQLQIEQNGVVVDIPTGSSPTIGTDALSGSGPYACDGDLLRIVVDDDGAALEATFDRIA